MSLSRKSRPARSLAHAAGVLSLAPAAVMAQDQLVALAAAQPLEAVVVSATRTPTRVADALAEVTVIERAQIEAAGSRTLPEVLASQPGMQFSANGGLGKTSTVYTRGLEGRHTLLLIDGVRYGSATTGTPDWDNLPLDAIERIEIVRGPLSALYGSDAVGGVVQVFTRRGAQGLAPSAVAGVGSHGWRQLGAGLRFGEGAFDGSVNLRTLRYAGFSATNPKAASNFDPDRDGFDQDSADVRLGLALGGGWRAEAGALRSEGRNRFDDGAGADSRAKLLTQVLSLQASGPVAGAWRTTLRAARSTNEYDTVASAKAANVGTIATVQEQLSWENSVATPLGMVLVLAEHTRQQVSRPGQPFTQSERRINAVALGLDGAADAHHWQVAVRRDRNSQFGGQTTGSVGYGYDVLPTLRVGASAGSSFVAPSFNQLYYPGFGNPNLQAEEGRHREINLRWADGPHQLRAAYYDNRIRGHIASGPAPTNVPRTRIDGVSVSYDLQLDDWSFAASADQLDPRNESVGTAHFDKVLRRRARQLLRLSAQRRLGAWTIGGALLGAGHRYDDEANKTRLAGYAVLDLHAEWRMARDWRLGFKLNNVADRRYETANGFNQPGRELLLTLRYAAL
ncbi:TonB-dependent receptor [uncultured Azohydromonas sp.]|uniref:TonB-dependent receptor domain-containing protein n=1 Tax=uncultured Azohydromonas sp. TaxID=487342 RepID=UPI00261BA2D9|nr:TonB-dependent receptor [uncultured Azohydromonas sp.]